MNKAKRIFEILRKKPEFGVVLALFVVWSTFIIAQPSFFSISNTTYLLTATAELGIIAVGMSFLMISGEFDLSVGSVLGLAVYIMVYFSNIGISAYLAALITLVLCALIGAFNGIIVVKIGIPSFIVTLGSQMLWRGFLLYKLEGFPLSYHGDSGPLNIFGGPLYSGIRTSLVWYILLILIFHVILNYTSYGNQVYATGCNEKAAISIGVNTKKIKLINFIICSTLVGVAGISNLSRYVSAQTTLGAGKEFEAIASAVIGGNLLSGGYGSIIGTFIGSLLLNIIRTGLIVTGVKPYLFLSFTGIIVVVAVIINTKFRKRG